MRYRSRVMAETFRLLATDPGSGARRGRVATLHGCVETPAFMPVGTQATVKAMTPDQLREIRTQVLLGNTYHLGLRPGSALVKELGGLHRFMAWDGPILTDSGGFQVFSLAKLRRIRDDGIEFRSHLDGSPCFLGPREVMAIQADLGSDIAMVLDECPPHGCTEEESRAALERSDRWARECLRHATEAGFVAAGHQVFGIVQGSTFEAHRREAARRLRELPFSGFAIGGVSVGEPEPEMLEQVGWAAPELPADRPRYVMGVGTPPQLLEMVALGADLFDCVLPSREARHGRVYTPDGPMNLRNARFARDAAPLVEGLDNVTCRSFSRAYLRHLVMAGELLAHTLLTLHNLHFFLDLMAQARARIEAGDFRAWSRAWVDRYRAGEDGGADGEESAA